MVAIYSTKNGTNIYVTQGEKSEFDFIVRYQEVGKRIRTPKHIHLIIDIYAKRTGNRELTNELLDYFLDCIRAYKPSTQFPPILQFFKNDKIIQFSELEQYGEYSIDFLLIVTELILIQEKTNYPSGVLNEQIFSKLRNDSDIFSIVSAATFTGR